MYDRTRLYRVVTLCPISSDLLLRMFRVVLIVGAPIVRLSYVASHMPSVSTLA